MARSMAPLIDPEIETLSRVFDVAALASALRGSRLGSWHPGAIEEIQLRALRHHEGQRCTLEIGLRTEGDWQFLIGKVYHDDRLDVFQAMEAIERAGFGPQEEFSIPQPLAYLPSLRFLLQEKVKGPTAGDIFKNGDEESHVAAAEQCALWLARFHGVAPKGEPVSYASHYLNSKSMRRCSRKITKLSGRLADKAGRLLQRLEVASSSLSPVELRAGHGSFSASHVILLRGRTVAIDWDYHEVADPACDIARFLAALRRRALVRLGSIRLLDSAAGVFLKTYLSAGQPEAVRNLPFFEAATYLNLAVRHLSDAVPDCQERTEAMLDQGLGVLDGGTLQ